MQPARSRDDSSVQAHSWSTCALPVILSAGANSKIRVTVTSKSIATNVCADFSYSQFYAEEVADPKSFDLTHPAPAACKRFHRDKSFTYTKSTSSDNRAGK
jgi:hypothetical protein